MDNESRQIENADGGRPLRQMLRSLARWFETECVRLSLEQRLFSEERARRLGCGETVADLDEALAENRQEQAALNAGWKHSSLRREVERRCGSDMAAGILEQRAVMASSASHAAAEGLTDTSGLTATSISGYGIVYNKLSQNLGGFVERIEPGACTQAINTCDVRCVYNHDSNYLLGRSTAATLELSENSAGVRFVAHLLRDDPMSTSIARRSSRLELSGCSFSFSGAEDRWVLARKSGDTDVRVITRINQIFDIGPVGFPAYPDTTVSANFQKLPQRSAAPAAEPEPAMSVDEYFAEADEEIQRVDQQRAQQRERQSEYEYQEMGRLIQDVNRWRTAHS